MALLNIVEFKQIQQFWTNAAQIAQQPLVTTQSITITGTMATSAAFNSNTNIVRLYSDTNCAIEFSQTATTVCTAIATSMPLAAFSPEYFGVTPGFILAVMTTP